MENILYSNDRQNWRTAPGGRSQLSRYNAYRDGGGGPFAAQTLVAASYGLMHRYSGGVLVKDRTLSYLNSFQRSTQAPVTETETLDLEQAPTTQFQLRIVNGERDGSLRLSSGSIRINGAEVVSSEQLNQQVEFLSAVLSLQQRNTIEVTLAAKPEGTLLLTLEPLSQAPPPNP